MDQRSGTKRATDYLYPSVEPFDQRFLDTGDGHQIYVEQSGNREGIPVIVFHGGPGGGSSPTMRRYFDPQHYRIILFDQRGCGRSRPHASVEQNTTWDLVADAEKIRVTLGLNRIICFGGSWGATLALVYALTHPSHVRHLVLRGVFLSMQSELDWFYGGGAGGFFPEEWARLVDPIPEGERGDLIAAYHRRLFGGNYMEEVRCARVWSHWENELASMRSLGGYGEPPAEYARAFARLENHYFLNKGFLAEDGWILKQRRRIEHIAADIVQGRYDMVCPPLSAHRLADGWAAARLEILPMAGHALSEPAISEALVRVMDRLRDTYPQ